MPRVTRDVILLDASFETIAGSPRRSSHDPMGAFWSDVKQHGAPDGLTPLTGEETLRANFPVEMEEQFEKMWLQTGDGTGARIRKVPRPTFRIASIRYGSLDMLIEATGLHAVMGALGAGPDELTLMLEACLAESFELAVGVNKGSMQAAVTLPSGAGAGVADSGPAGETAVTALAIAQRRWLLANFSLMVPAILIAAVAWVAISAADSARMNYVGAAYEAQKAHFESSAKLMGQQQELLKLYVDASARLSAQQQELLKGQDGRLRDSEAATAGMVKAFVEWITTENKARLAAEEKRSPRKSD